MKYSAIAGALSLCLVSAAAHAQTAQTEANKALVIRFYNALVQGDISTLQALGRPDYIQHNPAFETGLAALIKRISLRPGRPPGSQPTPPRQFVRTTALGVFMWKRPS